MNKYEHSFFIFAKILNLISFSDEITKVYYKTLQGKCCYALCEKKIINCKKGSIVNLNIAINKFGKQRIIKIEIYDKPIKLSLCSNCSQAFYNLENHVIKRFDKRQNVKEPCAICGFSHMGYEYLIFEKKEVTKNGT